MLFTLDFFLQVESLHTSYTYYRHQQPSPFPCGFGAVLVSPAVQPPRLITFGPEMVRDAQIQRSTQPTPLSHQVVCPFLTCSVANSPEVNADYYAEIPSRKGNLNQEIEINAVSQPETQTLPQNGQLSATGLSLETARLHALNETPQNAHTLTYTKTPS